MADESFWKKMAREEAEAVHGLAPVNGGTGTVQAEAGSMISQQVVAGAVATAATTEKKKRGRKAKIVDAVTGPVARETASVLNLETVPGPVEPVQVGNATVTALATVEYADDASDTEDKNERYLLDEDKAWILSKLGVEKFDLDVAACDVAHVAENFYTKATNGLVQPWFPAGVMTAYCNPPWDDLDTWLKKAWNEIRTAPTGARIAFVMPGNRTEQPFWQQNVEPARDGRAFWWAPDGIGYAALRTDFFEKRTRFGSPSDPKRLLKKTSPNFTCVLLTFCKMASP